MPASYVTYSGTGAPQNLTITFGYLHRDHIEVRVGGVLKTVDVDYTFTSDTVINGTFTSGTNNVEVRRNTPRSEEPYVDFTDGSFIDEEDLDNAILQALYVAEEIEDDVAICLTQDSTGHWDAESLRIKNVATPTTNTDAVTKAYADAIATNAGNVPTPGNPTDNGKILQASSGSFSWQTKAVTAAQISDSTATGRSLVTAADAAAVRTAAGATAAGSTLLTAADAAAQRTALDVSNTAQVILDAIIDAKGDLIAGSAADTPAIVTVGANNTILVADSAQTPGMKWESFHNMIGLWTQPAYSAGNFTGSGTISWTVAEADVSTYSYSIIGKTMFLAVTLRNTSVSGTGAGLRVAIPGGRTAARDATFAIVVNDAAAGGTSSIASVVPGGTYVECYKNFTGSNWSAATNNTNIDFTAVIELQ